MISVAAKLLKNPVNGAFVTAKISTKPSLTMIGVSSQKRWMSEVVREGEKKKKSFFRWYLLVMTATAFGWGFWQLKRKEWKLQIIEDLQKQKKIAPLPLAQNLEELKNLEYRLVKVHGKFLLDKEMFLGPRSFIQPSVAEQAFGFMSRRNSPNDYLVITPFQLADRSEIILINRGWVSRRNLKPETRVAGQNDKEVELTGVVRLAETRPQGDVFLYRDLPKMCQLSGAAPVFLDATPESTICGGRSNWWSNMRWAA